MWLALSVKYNLLFSRHNVWAGVWEVSNGPSDEGRVAPVYSFLGQTTCTAEGPAYSGIPESPCPEDEADRGQGNVFIGTGFSDPGTRSWIDNFYIAHWKNQ